MKRTVMAVCLAGLMAAGFSGNAMGGTVKEEESTQAQSLEPVSDILGEWTGEDVDSRYRLTDGRFLENSWLSYDREWYYLDENGYPLTGWQKIKGKWYYFGECTGRMAVGWVYSSEEDEWYYLNEDGTRRSGWLETGGVWYWFDSDGVMYDDGWRMVDGHKYYFNKNGQLASSQYIGTNYYGADGLRDPGYDMVIHGKRKPSEEEREQITEALQNVPRQWMEKFLASGWEFMYYTDRKYMEAPMTDEGIFYVYHKTDVNYKKIKFTDPSALARAFGEYVAHETGNDKAENEFLADFYLIFDGLSSAYHLPSYFDDDSKAWFGVLFETYCEPELRSEVRILNSALADFMEQALGTDFDGLRPSVWDMEMDGEDNTSGATGPAIDPDLNPAMRQ